MKTKILMVALMLLAMTPAIQAKSSTKTVAHRGYWKCEGSAENSLTSLRKAHDVGCWGSELDIWLTSDGGLVVNHDPKTLDGLKIEETDFKTITKSYWCWNLKPNLLPKEISSWLKRLWIWSNR